MKAVQRLEHVLERLGQVVAAGQPGELLVYVGMKRLNHGPA